MKAEPLRPADPGAGYHRILARRRFRYIERDPAHSLRITWIATPVVCPVCETDVDLQLVLDERTDVFVQVHCPRRHDWSETAIDPQHFRAYSRLQWSADPDPNQMWILDEGFGEEPPGPIDLDEVKAVAKTVGRLYKGQAKRRVKGAVRKRTRAARRRAGKAALTPVTATVRALRGRRSRKADQAAEPAATSAVPPLDVKTPSVAKYRKAYGMPAPKRGPKCLVCEDTHTIPGTRIRCTECAPSKTSDTS
jgi:hypothetical protein